MDEPRLLFGIPCVDEYRGLRVAAGLSPAREACAVQGLPGSWCAVCLRDDAGRLLGMGRVVGDGCCCFQVVDIAVLPDPERQGRGLGKRIMAALMERLREHAPAGALVTLLADGEAHRLYRSFGFELSAPASQGMLLRL